MSGKYQGKMDRGAEMKEEVEEDVSHGHDVVVAGVCD